ncbi:MAG: hypothetical protein ABIT20_20940 [Gemmatimonadaceae bacterium]
MTSKPALVPAHASSASTRSALAHAALTTPVESLSTRWPAWAW